MTPLPLKRGFLFLFVNPYPFFWNDLYLFLMKYIISENRLTEFIISYLNSFVENKAVSYLDPFIVISQANQGDDELWDDYMEYDYTDGRLWINKSFLKDFIDLFAFKGIEDARTSISKWFENKFDVEVKFVE